MTTPSAVTNCVSCQAPVSVSGSREGTQYYVETGTGEVHACKSSTPSTTPEAEMPESTFNILSNAANADAAGMASEYDKAVLALAGLYHDEKKSNADLRTRLEQAERDRGAMKAALMNDSVHVHHPLKDGTPVQWLGVYVLRWRDRDEPTHGFSEWTEDEIEALLASSRPSPDQGGENA